MSYVHCSADDTREGTKNSALTFHAASYISLGWMTAESNLATHTQWTSSTIQNELLEILSKFVHQRILEDVRKGGELLWMKCLTQQVGEGLDLLNLLVNGVNRGIHWILLSEVNNRRDIVQTFVQRHERHESWYVQNRGHILRWSIQHER